MTGQQMGTVMYMSPEQVLDLKGVGKETDYYSLGMTFYFLLRGKTPYDIDIESTYRIQSRIIQEAIDLSEIPANWQGILSGCLTKDAGSRRLLLGMEWDQLKYVSMLAGSESTLLNNASEKSLGAATPKQLNNEKTSINTQLTGSNRGNWLFGGLFVVVLCAGLYTASALSGSN